MLKKEFERLTGIYPDSVLYAEIEHFYYQFKGDKEDFCFAYKNNMGGLAELVQKKANESLYKRTRELEQVKIAACEEKNSSFTKDHQTGEKLLEEEEWVTYINPKAYSDKEYEKLRKNTNLMVIDDAVDLISRNLGFNPNYVEIINKVNIYMKNRHGKLKKVGEKMREPLYSSTDWNYIRFDCRSVSYEFINGQLRIFEE